MLAAPWMYELRLPPSHAVEFSAADRAIHSYCQALNPTGSYGPLGVRYSKLSTSDIRLMRVNKYGPDTIVEVAFGRQFSIID